MKKLSILLAILLSTSFVFAQEFEVPKNYKLKKKSDYEAYEKDVIAAVNWLLATPVNQETEKRKKVNGFLMAWLEGSPNVTIELDVNIVNFMECGDCFMIFMGGWAKYALEKEDFKNKLNGNLAGIESVIELYKANKEAIGKNKQIEKYIKLQDKGELKAHIESKL